MGKVNYSVEQIITILRKVEVNVKMRDEFLNINIFRNEIEAKILVYAYNDERPHSSLNYYTPAAYQMLMTKKRQ